MYYRYRINEDLILLYTFLRYLYSLILTLALPFIFLRLYIKSLKVPSYRSRWPERLGFFKSTAAQGGIWIHAVSVGEVVATLPLINALQAQYPQLVITVTTTTATGSQRLKQSVGAKINHMFMPYDLGWALQRVFTKIKPCLLIVMETELWPNLLYKAQQNNVPVVIVNARISDRSLHGYARIRFLTKTMLQQIAKVFAQSQHDAERFVTLGLVPNKLEITGNLKFDVQIPIAQLQLGMALKGSLHGRTVWIAASTHAGEETQVLQAFMKLRMAWPNLLLILVPRHPARFDEVAQLIEGQQLSYVRRSTAAPCNQETQVLLGDTMGELNVFYAAADIAFVGGSLIPIGGHNLLEPAAAGVATLSGPYLSNFQEITDKLLDCQALFIVQNVQDMCEQIDLWLHNPALCIATGVRGLDVVEQNRGATAKALLKLTSYFDQSLGL